jgi:hypothetical protein
MNHRALISHVWDLGFDLPGMVVSNTIEVVDSGGNFMYAFNVYKNGGCPCPE